MRGAAIILAMLIAALAAAVAATVFADQQRWGRTVELPPRPGAGAGARAGRRAMGAADSRGRRAADPRSIISASRGRWRCRRFPWRTARSAAPSSMRRGGSTSTRSVLPASRRRSARASRRSSRSGERRPRRSPRSADWIDEDGAARDSGAEDAFYLAQPRAASRAERPAASRRRIERCARA